MGQPLIQETLIELSLSKIDTVSLSILSVGNPHAIMKVLSIDNLLAEQLGSEISTNTYFPKGANVGFMQIMTPHHIRLRTFERGVGETFACGSNACAAVVAGITNGWLKKQVQVEFRYGSLFIHWEDSHKPIQMTGPASRVFTGTL
jgi:diaminopimelate epimerase